MSFVIPSSPEDRKSIHDALKEVTNHMSIIDGARDAIKEIKSMLKDDYDVPKRTAGRLAKTMHAQDFKDKEADFEDFTTEFEMLVKGVK